MKKTEISTAFFIAKKNLVKNRNSLLLTILIISLGFISSIITYGVLSDVGYKLQENYIDTTMGHIVLEPYGDNDKIENPNSIVKEIKTLPNIDGIEIINKKTARLYDANGDYIDTPIYIVHPDNFAEVSVVDNIVKEGTYLNKGEKGKILLGCMYVKDCNNIVAFQRIDVKIGDGINIIFDGKIEKKVYLQGIYDHNFIQAELISYINEATAEDIFPEYDSSKADEIIIRLPDRSYVEKTLEELNKMNVNAKISSGEEKASVNSGIIDSFIIIGNLSFFIGVIISAISVYVILYINILNKKTQIGIIKAIGIKSKIVSTSYVMVSLFLGIIGSLGGVLLTLIMTQYFKINPLVTGVGELAPRVSIWIFLIVFGTITVASTISGYLVSHRITKQNIIKSIFNG